MSLIILFKLVHKVVELQTNFVDVVENWAEHVAAVVVVDVVQIDKSVVDQVLTVEPYYADLDY